MNSRLNCNQTGFYPAKVPGGTEAAKRGAREHSIPETKLPGDIGRRKKIEITSGLPGDQRPKAVSGLTRDGRPAKKKGPKKKSHNDESGLISLSKAAAIYREITGRRKSLKVLADIIHERPHLAVFDFDLTSCRPHFLGVRRDRWAYFLKTRYLMYGSRDLFHANEL